MKESNGTQTQQQKQNDKIISANNHLVEPVDHRGKWSRETEFIFSCISMSVGLGNIWRFPYVAYENGGGAFLIPYLIVFFLIGRPLYYMEMILGQFSSEGLLNVWKCLPILKGVGFAQIVSTIYLLIFYNYLIALIFHYFMDSFQHTLPWTTCHPDWTVYCPPNAPNPHNFTFITKTNRTETLSQQYYLLKVLKVSTGITDINWISWELVTCLALTVTIVYLTISKGVKSSGKVAYFTALFPYFVLITILIVSLLNDGAIDGIIYFFKPNIYKLLDVKVWYRAVEQVCFSLNVAFGSIIIYSSYNDFKTNVSRNVLIITGMDTFTSILAGSVIFSVLGSMAYKMNMRMEDVINISGGGDGLAFIVYPEALSAFKVLPQIWSALFFFMLFTLGIGTVVAPYECILTSIKDNYPHLHKYKHYLALSACLFFFIFGLPLTTDAGTHIFKLLDNYAVSSALVFYAIVEVTGVMWIYGCRRFCEDAEFMSKKPVSIFWRISWAYITPAVLIIIFLYGNYLRLTDESKSDLVSSIIAIVLSTLAVGQIPLWAIITILKNEGSLKEKIVKSFTPKPEWGPKDTLNFREYVQWKNERRAVEKLEQSCDNHISDYL